MKYVSTLSCALVRENSVKLDLLVSNFDAVAKYTYDFIGDADREHFILLNVNVRGRVTSVHTISIGTLDASLAHPREIFKVAILANAHTIILAHNHPSNEIDPSENDLRLTDRITKAGDILGIGLLEHLVLGTSGFYTLMSRQYRNYPTEVA